LSDPEITARLLLSRQTMATRVSYILKKLDVHSRTDIARKSAHSGSTDDVVAPELRASAV